MAVSLRWEGWSMFGLHLGVEMISNGLFLLGIVSWLRGYRYVAGGCIMVGMIVRFG